MTAMLTVLGDLNKGCRYCGTVEQKTSENGKLTLYHPGVECCYSALDDQIRFRQDELDRANKQLIEVELYALSESVAVRAPEKALVLEPPAESYWVHVEGGAWLVLDDYVIGFVDYSWLNPNLVELIGEVANVFRRKLRWVGDIDARAEHPERLAVQSGLSERDILQQLLANGRLKR